MTLTLQYGIDVFMILTTFAFTLLLLAAGSIIWQSIKNGISPMPTSSKVKQRFLSSLPQNLNKTIYELGAGWGTLAFPIARLYPQAQVIGYESSLIPYLFCKLRLAYTPVPNLSFRRQNFFNADLSDASLVVCYLYPGAMHKLKLKFQDELSPSATIATHTFTLPGWKPIYQEVVNDLYNTIIYHYRQH